jgi:hypothetical protein
MVRTLLGVVLSGTVLLGWCWYYSDHLPQNLQQVGLMTPRAADGAVVNPAAEDGSEMPVTFVQGPLAFNLFAQDAEAGMNWKTIGLGLSAFLCVSVVAAWLLMMARLHNYFARVAFVMLLGVFAAALVQTCDYLFWQQTLEVSAYKTGFFVSAALIAGIVLAIFVRPQPTAVKVPVRVR